MRSTSRARALSLALLLSSTMTTACLTTDRPAVTDSARQDAPASLLPASGSWQNGDEHITWTSIMDDAHTVVTELVTFGSDGTARRTIRLDSTGGLVAYDERRRQTAQATDRSPSVLEVELALAFRDGQLASSEKRVDGAPAPVRDYEVTAARTHAQDLLARFGRASTPPSRN